MLPFHLYTARPGRRFELRTRLDVPVDSYLVVQEWPDRRGEEESHVPVKPYRNMRFSALDKAVYEHFTTYLGSREVFRRSPVFETMRVWQNIDDIDVETRMQSRIQPLAKDPETDLTKAWNVGSCTLPALDLPHTSIDIANTSLRFVRSEKAEFSAMLVPPLQKCWFEAGRDRLLRGFARGGAKLRFERSQHVYAFSELHEKYGFVLKGDLLLHSASKRHEVNRRMWLSPVGNFKAEEVVEIERVLELEKVR